MTPEEKDDRTVAQVIADRIWPTFDKNERTLVRYGMFPAAKMAEAERELAATRDGARLLAVALMNCASRDGGMRA